MVEKNSLFFDEQRAKQCFEQNRENLDDVNGFETLLQNSLFWNVYDKKGYIGSIFVYQSDEDNRFYLGGFARRKSHSQCVEAIKKVTALFDEVYADTRHLNAVICLKKAGFEWLDRKKRLLVCRRK